MLRRAATPRRFRLRRFAYAIAAIIFDSFHARPEPPLISRHYAARRYAISAPTRPLCRRQNIVRRHHFIIERSILESAAKTLLREQSATRAYRRDHSRHEPRVRCHVERPCPFIRLLRRHLYFARARQPAPPFIIIIEHDMPPPSLFTPM